MITAAGSEPGPGGVSPGAVIHAGCADSGGGGQSQHRMGLGHGGPDTRGGLAVSLAEQTVRLSGQFLSPALCSGPLILSCPGQLATGRRKCHCRGVPCLHRGVWRRDMGWFSGLYRKIIVGSGTHRRPP